MLTSRFSLLVAISDPNTNTKVFGSGAIVHYLITTYEKSNTLTYDSSSPKEAKEVRSWFEFQSMGRGPYAGFAAWYVLFQLNSTSEYDGSFSLSLSLSVQPCTSHLINQSDNRVHTHGSEPLPLAEERYVKEIKELAS